MKGIEILTKEPILELSKTLSIICMILFAVFIISLICMFVFIGEGYYKHIAIFAIISLVFLTSTLIILVENICKFFYILCKFFYILCRKIV